MREGRQGEHSRGCIGGGAAVHLHLVEFERNFVKGVVSFRLKREHCDSRGCGTVVGRQCSAASRFGGAFSVWWCLPWCACMVASHYLKSYVRVSRMAGIAGRRQEGVTLEGLHHAGRRSRFCTTTKRVFSLIRNALIRM